MKKFTRPATARSLAVESRTTWLSVRIFSNGSSLFSSLRVFRSSGTRNEAGWLERRLICTLLPQWPGGVVYISGCTLAVALHWRTFSATPTTVAVYHGSLAWFARNTWPIGSLFGQHL